MNYFEKLKIEIDDYDVSRQKIKKLASDITKKSKKAIFELHRDNHDGALGLLDEVKGYIQEVEELARLDQRLRFEGSYRASLEEYVESKLFYHYLVEGKILEVFEEFLGFKEIIGGLCDFTGEIVRRARLLVTKGDYSTLEHDYAAILEIMEALVEMNLSSYLRTKFDQMKRNVFNMEQIQYSVSLIKK